MKTPTDRFSKPSSLGDITSLLLRLQNDRSEMVARLFPVVYHQLRQIAGQKFRRERPGHTLQPTELVHETFVRLSERGPRRYDNRAHFFGVASRIMDQFLVDHARRRGAKKRAGAWTHVSLDDTDFELGQHAAGGAALADALRRLASFSPPMFQIAMLRGPYGFSTIETAALVKAGESTVRRDWRKARLWLQRELEGHQ